MKNKALASLIAMTLVFSMAACGKTAPAENTASDSTAAQAAEPQVTEEITPEATEEAPAENDTQNPVMNYVGVYSNEYSTEAMVEAGEGDTAKITVTYAGSPWFHNQTVMSGHFDAGTQTMEFTDAALTEYTYASDGSVKEETVAYTDGTGKAVFDAEKQTLTITHHFESGDSEEVFAWGPSSDMKTVSDPDHYKGVTAMDKFDVETVVGFNVRTAYLSENWYELADMIWYPITINGTELYDSEDFLGYMVDKTVHESDWEAMNEEDYLDMFVNGEGICMGSGQVWLNDPGYMTDAEPELKIIAISGIVSRNPEAADAGQETDADAEKTDADAEKTDSDAQSTDTGSDSGEEVEVNSERDFYATPSVTIYDKYGEASKIYESSDGYWREEDGTAYERIERKVWQLKDSDEIFKIYVWEEGEELTEELDLYSYPSVTVYDDDYNAYKLYEGADGYWREENGTAYERIKSDEFQLKDSDKIFYVR